METEQMTNPAPRSFRGVAIGPVSIAALALLAISASGCSAEEQQAPARPASGAAANVAVDGPAPAETPPKAASERPPAAPRGPAAPGGIPPNIGLDADQQRAFAALDEQRKVWLAENREELDALRAELAAARRANDRAAVKSVQDRLRALRESAPRLGDILGDLSDEQRASLRQGVSVRTGR